MKLAWLKALGWFYGAGTLNRSLNVPLLGSDSLDGSLRWKTYAHPWSPGSTQHLVATACSKDNINMCRIGPTIWWKTLLVDTLNPFCRRRWSNSTNATVTLLAESWTFELENMDRNIREPTPALLQLCQSPDALPTGLSLRCLTLNDVQDFNGRGHMNGKTRSLTTGCFPFRRELDWSEPGRYTHDCSFRMKGSLLSPGPLLVNATEASSGLGHLTSQRFFHQHPGQPRYIHMGMEVDYAQLKVELSGGGNLMKFWVEFGLLLCVLGVILLLNGVSVEALRLNRRQALDPSAFQSIFISGDKGELDKIPTFINTLSSSQVSVHGQ